MTQMKDAPQIDFCTLGMFIIGEHSPASPSHIHYQRSAFKMKFISNHQRHP